MQFQSCPPGLVMCVSFLLHCSLPLPQMPPDLVQMAQGPCSHQDSLSGGMSQDLAPTHPLHQVLLRAYCVPGAALPSGTAGGNVDCSCPVIVHWKQRNAIHISAPTWSMNKEGSQRRAYEVVLQDTFSRLVRRKGPSRGLGRHCVSKDTQGC